ELAFSLHSHAGDEVAVAASGDDQRSVGGRLGSGPPRRERDHLLRAGACHGDRAVAVEHGQPLAVRRVAAQDVGPDYECSGSRAREDCGKRHRGHPPPLAPPRPRHVRWLGYRRGPVCHRSALRCRRQAALDLGVLWFQGGVGREWHFGPVVGAHELTRGFRGGTRSASTTGSVSTTWLVSAPDIARAGRKVAVALVLALVPASSGCATGACATRSVLAQPVWPRSVRPTAHQPDTYHIMP